MTIAREGGPSRPARNKHTAFRQACNLIPGHMVEGLVREFKIDARKFSGNSHVNALLYTHLGRTESLNETCDALRVHEAEFLRVRGSTAPARNTFSNANRTRDPAMAEALYWRMLKYLGELSPGFTEYGKHAGFIHRLKREVFAMDSTTLQLTLASIDWARHRRRKAAAKCHMRLNVGSFLPAFAVAEDAGHHDSKRAWTLCEGVKPGDCVVADRAYTDFAFMFRLDGRGAFFVVREKTNMRFKVLGRRAVARSGKDAKVQILADETVEPVLARSKALYPEPLRRVRARVEVDGRMAEMVFLTNNSDWSARTVAELYKARWSVELFFKELKQTCQIHDFVGYNENAVKWQVWTGMLVHLLLRFMKHVSKWDLSFSRLVGIVRAAVWVKRDLLEILGIYGTASPPKTDGTRQKPPPIQACFEFARFDYGTA